MAPKRKAEGGGEPAGKKAKIIKVDSMVPNASAYSVVGDYNAKLNQTNVAANNNKYYFIQLLTKGPQHFVWTRWGRVGDAKGHQTKLEGPYDATKGVKGFRSKFLSKTKNQWDKRADFKPVAGRYTLIDVDESEEKPAKAKTKAKAEGALAQKTKLNAELAGMLKVIFDQDMFKREMARQNVDVEKLPLGKLSKAQISKGNSLLGQLQAELAKPKKNKAKLVSLSSAFYTNIPHNFGWKKPPAIETPEQWSKKVDLVNTLNDIELAQRLQGKGSDPLMDTYSRLNNKIQPVPPTSKEYKIVQKYFDCTKRRAGGKLLKLFSLERKGEKERMLKAHSKLGNHRLLWHGTCPGVVAAILNSGLRIMPHSGGRVGKGIYLASENSKSAGYTGTTKVGNEQAGFMFLVEAALGKMSSVDKDGPPSRLKAAPKGFDSVKAEGRTETFDGKKDAVIQKQVPIAVPQQRPVATTWKTSNFSQSEYLVYKESQAVLRYLCLVKL